MNHVRERELGLGLNATKFVHSLSSNENLYRRVALEEALDMHQGCVNCLNFSDTGDLLVSGSDDGHLHFWDTQTRKHKAAWRSGHTQNIFSVQFMPESEGRIVVSGAADNRVKLHDLDRESTSTFKHHRGRVSTVLTEPGNPDLVISASEDCTVRQVDIRQREVMGDSSILTQLATPGIHSIDIAKLRPWMLAVGAADETLRIFDRRMLVPISPGQTRVACLASLTLMGLKHDDCREFITGVRFTDSGSQVLASYLGDYIYLFDIDSEIERRFNEPPLNEGKNARVPSEDNASDKTIVYTLRAHYSTLIAMRSDTGEKMHFEKEKILELLEDREIRVPRRRKRYVAKVLGNLSIELYESGSLRLSARYATQAVKLAPDYDGRIYYTLARCLQKLGRLKEALDAVDGAQRICWTQRMEDLRSTIQRSLRVRESRAWLAGTSLYRSSSPGRPIQIVSDWEAMAEELTPVTSSDGVHTPDSWLENTNESDSNNQTGSDAVNGPCRNAQGSSEGEATRNVVPPPEGPLPSSRNAEPLGSPLPIPRPRRYHDSHTRYPRSVPRRTPHPRTRSPDHSPTSQAALNCTLDQQRDWNPNETSRCQRSVPTASAPCCDLDRVCDSQPSASVRGADPAEDADVAGLEHRQDDRGCADQEGVQEPSRSCDGACNSNRERHPTQDPPSEPTPDSQTLLGREAENTRRADSSILNPPSGGTPQEPTSGVSSPITSAQGFELESEAANPDANHLLVQAGDHPFSIDGNEWPMVADDDTIGSDGQMYINYYHVDDIDVDVNGDVDVDVDVDIDVDDDDDDDDDSSDISSEEQRHRVFERLWSESESGSGSWEISMYSSGGEASAGEAHDGYLEGYDWGGDLASDGTTSDESSDEDEDGPLLTKLGKLLAKGIPKHGSSQRPWVSRYRGHLHLRTIKQVSFVGPEQNIVASGSDDGRMFLWDRASGRLINALQGDVHIVNCVESHPHDLMLASAGLDSTVKIWTPCRAVAKQKSSCWYKSLSYNELQRKAGPNQEVSSQSAYNVYQDMRDSDVETEEE